MSYAETFADAGTKILQKEFRVIRSIYVDLEFLQDLRFGSILTHVKSPEELNYVYSQIGVYNSRYNEHTETYFPKLGITAKTIDEDMVNNDNFRVIAQISPMTSMFYNFNTLLTMYVRSNKYTAEGESVIKVYMNVHNSLYPDHLLHQFKGNLESRFGNKIEVIIVKKPRYSMDLEFYVSMDILFLYDFEGFINQNNTFATAFVAEGRFSEKYIFAKPQINDKFSNLSMKDKEQGVDKMRDQLNIYCEFEYAPMELVIFDDKIQEGGN